jgi:uncharacterized protein with PQ loop repeat
LKNKKEEEERITILFFDIIDRRYSESKVFSITRKILQIHKYRHTNKRIILSIVYNKKRRKKRNMHKYILLFFSFFLFRSLLDIVMIHEEPKKKRLKTDPMLLSFLRELSLSLLSGISTTITAV